jgi:hypothetical protein
MAKSNKLVYLTLDGHRLIGEPVNPTPDFLAIVRKQFPVAVDINQMAKDGIWIKREKHITYLSNDNIKLKRPASFLDREDT